MIILVFGPDTYRSSKKIEEIIREYTVKHKSGLNFSQLEWSVNSQKELEQLFSFASMFEEKKLVVVCGACFSSKDDQQKLIDLQKSRKTSKDESVILVFFEKGVPEKSILFDWLSKETKMLQRFDFLTGAKLTQWVKKEVQKENVDISPDATERLVVFVGSDLWQMRQEIDKLLSYKTGRQINAQDVELLVKAKYDSNIFATIDALASRNKNLAYKLLHRHLSQGENEIYILTMFIYQFRNMLQIKNLADQGVSFYELAKKTGLHPFVIKKTWLQIKNFSQEALKRIYERLFNLDIAIKRGKIEPQTALDLIVGEIAS